MVFESVGIHHEKGFVTEALEMLNKEEHPPGWGKF
jgi:hypothetical protein